MTNLEVRYLSCFVKLHRLWNNGNKFPDNIQRFFRLWAWRFLNQIRDSSNWYAYAAGSPMEFSENRDVSSFVVMTVVGYLSRMPRSARVAPGGEIYHVINRAAARFRMLRTDKDFLAFEKVMVEAMAKHPTRLLSYCLMGNHWHMVIWPREDGELSAFVRWLTLTHAVRWRVAHKTVGMGPLYQGRYKSFIVQKEESLELICRYVERNALSAGLVKRAEDWRWSSLWLREHGTAEQKALLSDWPIERGRNWIELVNEAMTEREVDRIQQSMKREKPMGSDGWTKRMIERHGLERTIRPEGRPRKGEPSKRG